MRVLSLFSRITLGLSLCASLSALWGVLFCEQSATAPSNGTDPLDKPPDGILLRFLSVAKELHIEGSKTQIQARHQLRDGRWRYICKTQLENGSTARLDVGISRDNPQVVGIDIQGLPTEYIEPRIAEVNSFKKEAEDVARNFLRKCGVNIADGFEISDGPDFSEWNGPGISIDWVRQWIGKPLREKVMLHVSYAGRLPGRIVWYSYSRYDFGIPENPSISQQKACSIARDWANAHGHPIGGVLSCAMTPFSFPGDSAHRMAAWDVWVYFNPIDKKFARYINYTGGAHVYVSIDKERVVFTSAVQVPYRDIRKLTGRVFEQAKPDYVYPLDSWPAWSPDGKRLLFASNRLHYSPSLSGSLSRETALFILEKSKLKVLVPEPPSGSLESADWSPDGKKIAFDTSAGVFELDIMTGELKRVSKIGKAPIWSPDGRALAVFTNLGNASSDVYVIDALKGDDIRNGMTRIGPHQGLDLFPTFAADGQMLYYAHSVNNDLPDNRRPFYLWGIPCDKESKPNASPKEMLGGLGYVFRMSSFHDRNALLVWDQKGTHVIDLKKMEIQELSLVIQIHHHLLRIKWPVPGPHGQTITFAGEFWDGDAEHEASETIHSCDMNGTSLRKITDSPAVGAERPVEFHHFEKTDKSASQMWVSGKE